MRRITRTRVFRRTMRPRDCRSRTPAAPPRARPMARRCAVSRQVRRAQGFAMPGSRSVKRRRGPMALRQHSVRTRRRHVIRSPRQGRSARVRVSRLWTCRAGTSPAGPRAAACAEEMRRVIWAWGASRLQASSWSGVVLGHTWARGSQPSKAATGPMRLDNPPSLYTSDGDGKGLTKTGQEP